MEYQVAYEDLSDAARAAWETVSGLPLTTDEQHRHAWEVLRAEIEGLAADPHAGLHVRRPEHHALVEFYVSGPELAALRVMIAWFKASDRAGRMRDLPVYPDIGEAIIGQLGPMPWPDVWLPAYLDSLRFGGTFALPAPSHAQVLLQLLDLALKHATAICPSWPLADRVRLFHLLCDVRRWLQSMLIAVTQ
jgi:hypothetical protein